MTRAHAWLAAVILAATFVALLTFGAFAHNAPSGWAYPPECCGGYDCSEIAADRVKPGFAGYIVDGRFYVPMAQVRFSPDGRFHACFPTLDNLRCLFVPPQGS